MVTFRRFRAYRYDNMSRIDVNLYARKVGLSLLHVDNYCGHMVKVRRFRAYIFDNMSLTYAYSYIHRYSYVLARQTVL